MTLNGVMALHCVISLNLVNLRCGKRCVAEFMQESIVFLVRVQYRRKESLRSLSHLLMSFFLIYIDVLAKLLESHGITAKLFADDVKVYFKICKLEGGYVFLQQALDLIATYGPVSGSSQYLLTNVTCLILDIAVK